MGVHERPGRRGFTLIEVMIVVSILAVLASIAIPLFMQYTMRTKQSERDLLFGDIERDLIAQFADHDQFPCDRISAGAGTCSQTPTFSFLFSLTFNPPLPTFPTKRPFNASMPGWTALNARPSSGVYHSYYFFAINVAGSPGLGVFYVIAYGDLDADGRQSQLWHYWRRLPGGWTRDQATETLLSTAPGIY
jgi:prepilin-type N-terminal cleavage/methylation domain-containing protein